MVKPLPINNQIRGTRRYAAPDSVYFRAWFAQKQRKDRKAGSEIQPLLLDTYSGAAAAYSLRSLTNTRLTQPVVRVRRSSDNTEQDFTAKQITDGTLVSFCGTGDGLVTTWYDQSGNGNDAVQTTAASQPKIVDAGVLVTESGKPAIYFNAESKNVGKSLISNNFFTFTDSLNISIFNVSTFLEMDIDWQSFWGFTREVLVLRRYENNNKVNLNSDNAGVFLISQDLSTFEENALNVFSTIRDSNLTFSMYLDGLFQDNQGSTVWANTQKNLRIGENGEGSEYSKSATSELILYPSDQSANREAIESNIASHYGITLA